MNGQNEQELPGWKEDLYKIDLSKEFGQLLINQIHEIMMDAIDKRDKPTPLDAILIPLTLYCMIIKGNIKSWNEKFGDNLKVDLIQFAIDQIKENKDL